MPIEITAADYRNALGDILPAALRGIMRRDKTDASVAALTMVTSIIGGLMIVTGCTAEEAGEAVGLPEALREHLTMPLCLPDGVERLARARAAWIAKTETAKAGAAHA